MFRTVNTSITVLVSLPDHLINLIVCELLTDRGHNVSQLSSGNEAIVVTVEYLPHVSFELGIVQVLSTNLESFTDFLLGVGVLHLSCHHGQEFWAPLSAIQIQKSLELSSRTGEVNRAVVVGVNLVDHVLELGLGRVLTEGSHNSSQFLGGDLAWKQSNQFPSHVSYW